MRVNFCLREDGERKAGGDTSKAQRLTTELRALGHDVDITYGRLSDTDVDVVHLVNLDLPIENLRYATQARRRRHKVVISTVHHPFAGIQDYYRYGDDEYFSALRRGGIGVERSISIREGVKLAMHGRRPSGLGRRTLDNQRRLARAAHRLLPMSGGEHDSLICDVGEVAALSVVPNGATFAPTSQAPVKRWDVVVVGRIEPRKNVLQVARAARELGVSALFMGALNSRHKAYVDAFLRTVQASSALTYAGSVANHQVPALVAQADLYVNAAWFEVVSQADVEAAGAGVRIATTKHSYIADVLGRHHQVDPLDFCTDPADTLERAMTASEVCVPGRLPTWSEAALRLSQVYAEVVA